MLLAKIACRSKSGPSITDKDIALKRTCNNLKGPNIKTKFSSKIRRKQRKS